MLTTDGKVELNPATDQPRHSLRTQLITTVKLLAGTGAVGMLLWLIDQKLGSP